MRHQELYNALHKVPFRPFRVQLTNGQAHVIPHPDFAWLTRTSILVGMASGRDEVPDEYVECDLLHVVAIEPVNGSSGRGGARRKRRPPR